MSDEKKARKKGGKGKKLVVIGGALLLLVGGGAAAGFYVSGGMNHGEAEPAVDPNRPQLVLKGENPEEVAAKFAAEAGHGEALAGKPGKGEDLPAPADPSKYQATYFQMPSPFTSNLSDSDAFAQISVAVSTYYDKRVIDAVTTHEMAIRSDVLMMLAEQSELALATPQGKEELQGKLKKAINGVLKSKTGYGGVDNVYFTNFVIQ